MLPRVLEPELMDTVEEAESYDAMDHSEPNAAFVERLIELGARGRMLDIGTGPGHIPLLLCERLADARVVAIDLAESMLAVAERRRKASPYGERVELRRGDAKGLRFADHSFDAVFSNTILHHLPDPRPFLAEAWRVLRPGGALLIRDLYRPPDLQTLERLVAAHAVGADERQKALFRASLHAALTPAELLALVDDLGLDELELTLDSDRHMSLQMRSRTSVSGPNTEV